MDKIRLNNIQIYAYHGLFKEEKKIGQKFQIDVELSVDLRISSKTDDINDTINYKEIYDKVNICFKNNKKNLIESVASDIADSILEDTNINNVKIFIKKPSAPINGICDSVEVELFREQ